MRKVHKYWFGALIWTLFILLVLLLPSPREWGWLGDWLSPRYDGVVHIIQPMAHVVFMGILAFLLMKALAGKPIINRLATAVMATVVVAIFFEAAQAFLPENFGRSSDPDDLVYALIGIGLGCLLGVLIREVPEDRN